MSSLPILQVRSLSKWYADSLILNDISFDVASSEVIGIIGKSGAGKSTLLRSLNLLEQPDQGEVWLQGKCFDLKHPAKLRADMTMVFQGFNLWPHRTAMENVTEGLITVRGLSRKEANKEARELLDVMGLADRCDAYPVHLSGGQQQRVAIARALAMKPAVVLFDEPTSALDPECVDDVLTLLKSLAAQNTTMLIVTHELSFALAVCDRLLLLEQGRLIADVSTATLADEPLDSPIRRFLSVSGIYPKKVQNV